MPSLADIFVIDEASQKTNYLLIIGIDEYVHCNKLRTAVSDAQAFRDTLIDLYDFKQEHLYELYNEQATKSAIHSLLKELVDKLTEEDNLIVYYAGHGEFNQKLDLGYWVPVKAAPEADWDFVSNDQLTRYFNKLRTHHLLVFSDSCFSGSLFAGTRETTYNNRKDSFPSRWAFTSGMNEPVVDDAEGMSPFAKHLIRTLQRAEGALRASKLIDEVSDQVVEDVKQTPSGGPIRSWGDDQGQFVFRPKRDEAKDWGLLQSHSSIENCQQFLKIYPEGKYQKEAQKLLQELQEAKGWERAQQSDTSWAYDQYLDNFPNSKHAGEAKRALEDASIREAWEEAVNINSLAAYRSFLEKYPTSEYIEDVENRRSKLKEEQKQRGYPPPGKPTNNPPKGGGKKGQITKPPSGVKKTKPPKTEVVTTPPEEEESKIQLILGYALIAVLFVGVFMGFNALKNYLFNEGKKIVYQEALKGKKGVPYDLNTRLIQPSKNYIETVKDISFKMVYVEGGAFTMGCTQEQGSDCGDNEKPAHQVTLNGYYIGAFEVTQALYQAVTGNNPSHFKGDSNRPVEMVSWNDAQTFIQKLNQLTGKKYRLPTEAEWEFAARGGNQSKGYKYAGSSDIREVAWYDGNSSNEIHPVGEKKANELGLYDMSGNVWEWCEDWYGGYMPKAEINPKGALEGPYRVYRGGSWLNAAQYCRVAYRSLNNPGPGSSHLGFRLAF